MSEHNHTCLDRLEKEYRGRISDLQRLWDLHVEAPVAANDEQFRSLFEYGLSFDYEEANTFPDQQEGYYRYQLSWGGPSDEFRFFVADGSICRIEYWFLDWFDGVHLVVSGVEFDLLVKIWFFLRGF